MIKNTNFKKVLWVLIPIAAIITAFYAQNSLKNRVKNSVQAFVAQGSNVAQEWQNKLKKEHVVVLENVRKAFSVDENIWQSALQQFQEITQKDDLLLAPSQKTYKKTKDTLANRIKETLFNAGINPDKVTIIYTNNTGCPLGAMQEFTDNDTRLTHAIDLNKKWFLAKPQEIQQAILAHEIMHLKQYDSIESAFILDALTRSGFTQQDYNASPAVHAYRQHRELRADLLAGATDMAIAQGLQKDFEAYIPNQYKEDLTTHPSSSTRLEKMNELISYLDTEKQLKLA